MEVASKLLRSFAATKAPMLSRLQASAPLFWVPIGDLRRWSSDA